MQVHYSFGPAPAGVDVLWRCEAKRYSVVIDADADIYGVSDPRLEMTWWRIDRRTPKGAWVGGQFIRLTAFKRWACNTEEEAFASFIARKKKHIAILSSQLRRAEADLALALAPARLVA
jgi:hypothetical protein